MISLYLNLYDFYELVPGPSISRGATFAFTVDKCTTPHQRHHLGHSVITWDKCTTPHQTHHLDHVQTISLYLNLYDFMNLYQDQAYQEVLLHIKDIISDIQSSPGINAPLHIKHIISDIQSSPACNLCQHPHLLLLWEILVFFLQFHC